MVSDHNAEPDAAAVSRETSAAQVAATRWPDHWEALQRYHFWLIGAGVERGLVGPREVPRMWDRHINNSAVIEEAIPHGATVIDVGSGAGLPGLPLSIVRPDLTVTLLEPLARRVDFLNEVITDLNLNTCVNVVRGRAEDARHLRASVVTSRAVAALPKLLTWSWPLVADGGQILAMKGEQAESEIESSVNYLRKRHLKAEVITVGAGVVDPLTRLVRVSRTN
ncbi:MAG: Ribosomal small subunit methyltransferase [Actinomycetota bacterium]